MEETLIIECCLAYLVVQVDFLCCSAQETSRAARLTVSPRTSVVIHVIAMAKRLRSLASALWETDDNDTHPSEVLCFQGGSFNELQRENGLLKEQVRQLLAEVEELKSRSSTPHSIQLCQTDSVQLGERWKQPWLQNLRHDVLPLPRLEAEILPELLESGNCDGKIVFEIPRNPRCTASQVTNHVVETVAKLSCKHPAVYKIGITVNPVLRWRHPVYGYSRDNRDKWEGMKVIAINSNSFSAALLESLLISKFKGKPGCRNTNPGGETSCPGPGPHFTYVVYRILVPPPRIVSRGSA